MRPVLVGAILAAGVQVLHTETRADEGGADGRRVLVVARVGQSRRITVGELEDRIGEIPALQRTTFGETPEVVRRRVLEQVLIPEVLLSLEAEHERLKEQPPASYAVERARSSATIRATRARIGPASAIPMQDVRTYYEHNSALYHVPERYQLWRILCKTREEAQTVLDTAKSDATPKAFSELAREHSLDKATYMRGGNLGFVSADGTSSEPGLRFDPAVVVAARGVRDGDFVPSPVAEGEYFAVVWRRGTVAARDLSVEDAAAQIRQALWNARIREETDTLVAGLRASKVHDLNEALLDGLELPSALDAAK
jgi:peptidyl-prolyl cis-trans isomerase C